MSAYSQPFEDEKALREAIARAEPIVREYIADIEEKGRKVCALIDVLHAGFHGVVVTDNGDGTKTFKVKKLGS